VADSGADQAADAAEWIHHQHSEDQDEGPDVLAVALIAEGQGLLALALQRPVLV
jgi:hypothetical protein